MWLNRTRLINVGFHSHIPNRNPFALAHGVLQAHAMGGVFKKLQYQLAIQSLRSCEQAEQELGAEVSPDREIGVSRSMMSFVGNKI